jgi:hypothetical protein
MSFCRKRVVYVVVAALAVVTALAFAGLSIASGKQSHQAGHTLKALGPPDGAALTALRAVATRVASAEGETNPVGGQVVSSFRDAANQLANGADIADPSAAYVVVLHGNFTADHAGPFGAAPRGHALTLVVSPTFDLLDLTISANAPDLSRLGDTESLG